RRDKLPKEKFSGNWAGNANKFSLNTGAAGIKCWQVFVTQDAGSFLERLTDRSQLRHWDRLWERNYMQWMGFLANLCGLDELGVFEPLETAPTEIMVEARRTPND